MRQTGKRGRKATSLPVRFVHAGKLCKGEKMVELQGYIDRIVFRNEENGYSVLCMKEGNKEEFLVGVFPDVSEGEYLTARGKFILLNTKLFSINRMDIHLPARS